MILEFREIENNEYIIKVETNKGIVNYNIEDYISNIKCNVMALRSFIIYSLFSILQNSNIHCLLVNM